MTSFVVDTVAAAWVRREPFAVSDLRRERHDREGMPCASVGEPESCLFSSARLRGGTCLYPVGRSRSGIPWTGLGASGRCVSRESEENNEAEWPPFGGHIA